MAKTTTPFPSKMIGTELPPQNIATPTYTQATIAAATFGRHVVGRDGHLDVILWDIGDNGTGSTTDFKFQLNGVDIPGASASIAGASHNHASGIMNGGVDVKAGDVIDCVVSQAASGTSVNLSYTPVISQYF